jgi:hypothetical protein
MAKVAYRFLPCDETGRPRENSQYTTVADDGEVLGVGSVLDVAVFGYEEWEVVEVRQDRGSFISAFDADGTPLGFGGTLVCRGVRGHS